MVEIKMEEFYIKNEKIALKVVILDDKLRSISFIDDKVDQVEPKSKVGKEVKKQLVEYFNKKRTNFDLPIDFSGTDYQNSVWAALTNIPYGETKSYKEIAVEIGNPNSSRAVGNANNKNPIPIVVPCHRVVGSDKKLVGYASGVEIKSYLLDLENKELN